MAQLKDSLITGDLRVTGTIYGNATSATALKDKTNNTLTYSNYGAAGLAGSSISWMTCWNGYELRAISKAETFNLVRDNGGNSTWVNVSGDTMTGTLNMTPASGEGGEIHLNASTANTTQAGIALDQLNSQFRIFGLASADGTTKTGSGTPLVIDPYAKTITGGYTLTGALTGHASLDLPLTGGILTGGLEIKGHIAGDAGSSGHGLWGGGGYHNAYNNIILHGDASTGTSGIAFVSDKGNTTINQPSDRAFIQWHAHGVTTYTAESTNPTLATSGENNILVIGVGNDAGDQIRLQSPAVNGLLHQVGATGYVIPSLSGTTTTANYPLISTTTAGLYANNTSITMNGGTITATSFSGSGANLTSLNAENISSGTLPIARGGTGATSAADAWTALGGGASGKHADNYFALASHTHGKITNAGAIANTDNVAIANNDRLVISDSSDSYILKNTSIVFDGSTATKALTQKGTWETFNNYSHPTGDGNLHVPANGTTNNGKFLQATATAGSYQWATPTDTKNTAGSTNSVSKIFLIGATSQAANPQTYSNGQVYIAAGTSGSSDGYLYARRVYNAVWNDYAEYRLLKEDIETPYGKVLIENGDDSVSVSTKRLQPGAMICSDTFGHCMGEEEHSAPISVAGRVLAYSLEPREQYNFFIGQAVCSGPNGTVSIMTKDEVKEYPECVVGYISAVPQYEEWGQNKIKVDGRVWIKIK